jgi:hypothetical protein
MDIADPGAIEPAAKPRTLGDWIVSTLYACGAIGVVLTAWVADQLGLLTNFLLFFALGLAPFVTVGRVWDASRGRLEYRFLRRPWDRAVRLHLIQCLNRWLFWIAFMIVLAFVIPRSQIGPEELLRVVLIFGAAIGLLMVAQLVPPKRVRLSTNLAYVLGWAVLCWELFRIVFAPYPSEEVVIDVPFRGEWVVLQGGPSHLINHHAPIPAQHDALDLIRPVDGKESQGDPLVLESYGAFGQTLYAPADGTVVRAVGDRPDLKIGDSDLELLVGNHLVFEVAPNRYVLMAHLMKGSLLVSKGDRVRPGQPVARCGNSGNTSAPHLHLQAQNLPDFDSTDLRTFPLVFRDATRIRWGYARKGPTGDYRRNDRISFEPPSGP